MLKRIKLPEGNDRVNLTFALFGIHCAKLEITEVLGLTNEDANERNRLFTIVNLFEKTIQEFFKSIQMRKRRMFKELLIQFIARIKILKTVLQRRI